MQQVDGLTNALAVVHPDGGGNGTFHGFRGTPGAWQIDYVLATPEWTVEDAAIVRDHTDGRYPSDHFPVRATLARP